MTYDELNRDAYRFNERDSVQVYGVVTVNYVGPQGRDDQGNITLTWLVTVRGKAGTWTKRAMREDFIRRHFFGHPGESLLEDQAVQGDGVLDRYKVIFRVPEALLG